MKYNNSTERDADVLFVSLTASGIFAISALTLIVTLV